jgi:hypothetical protein
VSDDVRVYRYREKPLVFVVRWITFALAATFVVPMEILLIGAALKEFSVAYLLLFAIGLYPLLFLSRGFERFLKMPRLEITSKSIRYVRFGYTLEAEWSDIERVAIIRQTRQYTLFFYTGPGSLSANVGRGLVANKYTIKRPKWLTYEYVDYQGIPIEPMFSRNIYDGELGNDIRRHAPHIFEA